jgi:O-antigen/teichoic acid export membrane protein
VLNLKQISNSLIYIGSDLLVKALPFFLIPIITRYLTLEEYGEVSLAQTFLEISTIGLIFGSHHFYRYHFFKDKINKEVLFIVPTQIAFFNFIFIFILVLIFYITIDTAKLWYLFVPFAALFQTVIALYICRFQTIEKPIFVGAVNFSQALIAFVATILLLYFGFGLEGRLAVVIATPMIIGGVALIYILTSYNFEQFNAGKQYFKDGFKFGAKAFPSSVSWWLRSGMDRVLLQYMVGTAAVGLFSIAVQFSLIISVISGAINNSIMPSIFVKVNNSQYRSLFITISTSTLVVALIAICLILVSPTLIEVVLPTQYRVVGDYFVPLIIGAVLHAFFLFSSNVFVAENMIAKLSTISIFSSVAHLLISMLMIYFLGLEGVVWSGVLSYSISIMVLITSFYYSKK